MNSNGIIKMEEFYWKNSNRGILPEEFYQKNFIGRILPEESYQKNCTGIILPEKWKFYWGNSTRKILSQQFYWKNFTRKNSTRRIPLEEFYVRNSTRRILLDMKFFVIQSSRAYNVLHKYADECMQEQTGYLPPLVFEAGLILNWILWCVVSMHKPIIPWELLASYYADDIICRLRILCKLLCYLCDEFDYKLRNIVPHMKK